MAVLVEANSIIIKISVIEDKFPGGLEAFEDDCPNQTYCDDISIVRIGFMSTVDVGSYIKYLQRMKFVYIKDNKAIDFVVADQIHGLAAKCDWLEFGYAYIHEDTSKKVSACQAVDDNLKIMFTPDGWEYEGSLSQTYSFAPNEHIDKSLTFLRHDDGLDVYYDKLTGKEAYIGRVFEK
ncbi:MAG: hypothetical protein HQL46_12235 [Gammaproteobacteria bacterium]|nr:hypothetical protein [Gammaproteobacteria bacterium]